ncbi:MAG TPA: outer membrane beta-barrel protein [Bryobacteraceae bacterium]|jgi:hypothetical protein|nr:outer membrane beta-barrel protein [Bryobacteraceae bacterium]
MSCFGRWFFLAATLLTLSVPAAAQNGHLYVFGGPGGASNHGTTTTIDVGGGGELLLDYGIGIGIEGGYLFPASSSGDGLGTVSFNGYYHFIDRGRGRWDPFVTGGYSGFFRSDYSNLGNFGGGANYWVSDRWGIKLEFRDHVHSNFRTTHFWNFRFGVNFR